MSTRDFIVLTDVSLITCVVQRGKAEQVVKVVLLELQDWAILVQQVQLAL